MGRRSAAALCGVATIITIGVARDLRPEVAPAAAPQVAAAPVGTRSQVVVGFAAYAVDVAARARDVAGPLGGEVRSTCDALGWAVLEAPGDARALATRAAALPGVAWAEPNRSASPAGGRGRCGCQDKGGLPAPAPDLHDLGEVATLLRLDEAWADAPAKGAKVLVALVDTGIDRQREPLRDACEEPLDLTGEVGAPADGHGHGSLMASIIAGRGEPAQTAPVDTQGVGAPPKPRSQGFRGVAPLARLLPVRVADERGGAPVDRVARGIMAAADRGAKVIYVGLAARGRSPTLASAVAHARAAGALVVCPAGNDGLDEVRSPAAEPGALAVGGSSHTHDGLEAPALCTNLTAAVPLAAPAEFVPSFAKTGACFTEGTSSAAALAAGVAALVWSRSPELDVAAVERCLLAGGQPLLQGPLAARLALRRLDAADAVARAHPRHAEVALDRVRVAPDAVVVGQPAKIEARVRNVGHVALGKVEVEALLPGAALWTIDGLAPGAEQTVTFTWTPTEATFVDVALEARAQPPEGAEGPLPPCVATAGLEVEAVAAARPSFAVADLRVVTPMTVDAPSATFEVEVENRGGAAGEVKLRAAVEGKVLLEQALRLAPGERASKQVTWEAPNKRPPSAPIRFEAIVEHEQDLNVDDDHDTLDVALQDPSLPLDPSYRQAGDIDFGIDAPWRLAGDRPHVPVLLFVPSIGRPSRYNTFHETLAMRRGAVNSTTSRSRAGVNAAGRVAGDLLTYTTATFVKELGEAARGDDQAIRRFFDKLCTTDFAIDYGLYAVGAAGGRKGWELLAPKAKNVPGLRWTGGSLGNTIARSTSAVALGYLLPNLVRGRFDRRIFVDLAALGLTTAGVEALSAGIRAGATRTAIGARTASWLARHGRVARVGGWAVDVAQLVLVLYASEWISNAIDKPLIRLQARRALQSSWDAARAAAAAPDEAAFGKALDGLEDAFDAYRNVMAEPLADELKKLNHELGQAARALFQLDTARTRDLPPALAESRDRVLSRREREAEEQVRNALKAFETGFDSALSKLESPNGAATLAAPGTSKRGVYDLELKLFDQLLAAAPGARKDVVKTRKDALVKQRDLDAAILRALVGAPGAATAPNALEAEVQGTDGLLLRRVMIEARDSWHEDAPSRELLEQQPNKYAPPGSVKAERLYEHDLRRTLVFAAPGVARLDEMGAVQQDVQLFDGFRPLTVKGRYNMLRIPRQLLEPLAVGGAVYLKVHVDWELTKVVRGALVRPAEGSYSQVLRVALADGGLPALPGLKGGYLDAHYHTIAEWYNPEPGFVADLELDAPRQKYGGPIPMLVESSYAIGAIDAPTYEAARDRLVTTDHNAFYVADDRLEHRPPYGPTSAAQSGGKTEHQRMRELLGESAAEELCYQKPGFGNTGVHMLDYRARHIDGTWNAQEPLGRLWRRWTDPLDLPTMEGVLGAFAQGGKGNEAAFAFASHPVSTIPWENEKLIAALQGFPRVSDQSFAFRGMQVWNSRSGRRHSLSKLFKYVDELNPFVSTTWQGGYAFDADIHAACVKYRHLLRLTAAMRHPLDERLRFVRKHYILAGSDAHGDFNYTVGGLATVILALAGLNDRTDNTLELEDSAFFKVRNFVATDGYDGPAFMNALGHGSSVVTDGPVVWFELDGDGRFDAAQGTLDLASPPRFQDREGRIGGAGAWDGGRTVLLANDARPVFRYAYTNSDDFGRPVLRDDLGRVTRWDGTLDGIAIYKTDLESRSFAAGSGKRLEADGVLPVGDGRQFGRAFTEALDEAQEGPVKSVSAIQLGSSTKLDANTSPADVYRCLTNPVWAVRAEVIAHLDATRFQNGVIAPGGLVVELTSPVSLAAKKVTMSLSVIDERGKSGAALATLEADGWRPGTDPEGKAYDNGVLRLSNRTPVTLRGLPVWNRANGANMVTLALVTEAPLADVFGNVLNRVASTFEVDPATCAPGKFADAKAAPAATTFEERRGLTDVLRDGR